MFGIHLGHILLDLLSSAASTPFYFVQSTLSFPTSQATTALETFSILKRIDAPGTLASIMKQQSLQSKVSGDGGNSRRNLVREKKTSDHC